MGTLFKRWQDFKGEWRWPHFSAEELSCNHCGEYYHDEDFLDKLEKLRELRGKPIRTTSQHRCIAHNKKVGGVANSIHLTLACDCVCPGPEQAAFAVLAEKAGFTGIGVYPTRNFVHIDNRPARARWKG